jgi:hypothetical protein
MKFAVFHSLNGSELREIWHIYCGKILNTPIPSPKKKSKWMGVLYTILFAFLNVLERPIYHRKPFRIELVMVDLLFGPTGRAQGFITKLSKKGTKTRPKKALRAVPKRH